MGNLFFFNWFFVPMCIVIWIRKQANFEILYIHSVYKSREIKWDPAKYIFILTRKFYRKSIIYATDAHLNSTIDVNHSRAPQRKSN